MTLTLESLLQVLAAGLVIGGLFMAAVCAYHAATIHEKGEEDGAQ